MNKLYNNRFSQARSFTPFQFNASIQSTQSVESFNAIIKRFLNSASSLCNVKKVIDKRHEDVSRYCKLINVKAKHITVGLPHLSSQFFSDIDMVLERFLNPLLLSQRQFQISQSFTYKENLVPSIIDISSIYQYLKLTCGACGLHVIFFSASKIKNARADSAVKFQKFLQVSASSVGFVQIPHVGFSLYMRVYLITDLLIS